MSETSTPNPKENEPSFREKLEQGGEFGINQRKKREEAAKPQEVEPEAERGLDGKPLAHGEWLDLYNRIIDSKVNNPDAGIRERAADWGLTFKQRHDMGKYDLETLEHEAIEELGRIEAKQQADKNAEAAAVRETAYQQEMSDFRAESRLYDTLYEAALAQLPEPELTATDPVERHYEEQQIQAARKEEAKQIAQEALEQFKISRNAHKTPEGSNAEAANPKNEEQNAADFGGNAEETQQIPQSTIDNLDENRPDTSGGTVNQSGDNHPFDYDYDPDSPDNNGGLPRRRYDTFPPADETQPIPRNVINNLDTSHNPDLDFFRPDLEDEEDEPLRPEKRRDRKLLKLADDLDEAVQALGEDLTDEERALIEEAERILQNAPKKHSPWQRFKRALSSESHNDYYDDDDEDGEDDPDSGEKKRRFSRLRKVGAAALAAVGILGVGYGAYEAISGSNEPAAAVSSIEPSNNVEPTSSVTNSPDIVDGGGQQGLPIAESNNAARMAEYGEGWFQTIREETGISDPQQLRDVLSDVGPDLVRMGQAYTTTARLGGYGISRPGELSDQALQLIHDAAQRRGYIG